MNLENYEDKANNLNFIGKLWT